MTDFIVVGAGPAGTRAAEMLVAAGHRPVVIDEAAANGGQIYRRQPAGFRRGPEKLYGSEAGKAVDLHLSFDRIRDRIDYRPEHLAWALRNGALHVIGPDGVTEALRYRALILCPGATDRVFPLPGWTQPGVYTLGAAQISLKAQAVAIGGRIVFMGAGPLLYLVAWQYAQAGAAPVAVLDTSGFGDRLRGAWNMAARPEVLRQGVGLIRDLRRAGVPVWTGVTPLAFEGDGSAVTGVRFRDRRGTERRIDCDAAGFGWHLRAETQLADLAGVPFAYETKFRQWLPVADASGRTAVKGVYLAGDGMQLAGADGAEASGRIAARTALADLGHAVEPLGQKADLARNRVMRRFRDGVAQAFPWIGPRLAAAIPDETVVCRCEEITAGQIRQSAEALGAPEMNRAKALCRVGMGRCQGRYCGLAGAEILAAKLGVGVEDVGRLRGQAPVKPLPANLRMKT